MAAGILVQDQQSNVLASAHRTDGQQREYELSFPLRNDDLGDTLWERGRTYMLAVLVGPKASYAGINRAVWMSDQVLIRLGEPSTESIYRPPLTAAASSSHGTPDGAYQHRH